MGCQKTGQMKEERAEYFLPSYGVSWINGCSEISL